MDHGDLNELCRGCEQRERSGMDNLEVTFSDAGPFLERAGSHLAADPVLSTVVSSVAARMAAMVERGEETTSAPYAWFAIVTEHGGEVVGAAMRTATFAPHPVYVLPMPDPAAISLAESVLAREPVTAVNGARRASEAFAATVASRTGGRVAVGVHTRLFELGELVDPRPVLGRIRNATVAEAPLALDWFHRFHRDADVQAGRPPTRGARGDHMTVADMEELIRGGHLWFWVDPADQPVHLTASRPPAFGVARIGPVYTPIEHRGRGFASATVAEVSRRLRADGARVTLFTDQANPTSNKIYEAIGFRPIVDMVELVIG